MNITRYIASRYLYSRKHVTLISVLTGISIAGLTVGTALLIIVLSVFNGFYDVIRGFLLSFDPDVRIEMADRSAMAYHPDFMQRILDLDDVVQVTPYVEGKAMVSLQNGGNEVVLVRGVERGAHVRLTELENSVQSGIFDLSVQNARPGIVISESLAGRFALRPGSELALLSASGMRRALTQFSAPRSSRFQVRGTYNIQQILDGDMVYVDLVAAQRLFNLRNEISGVELKLTDTDRAAAVKRELTAMLGEEMQVSTWYDLQKPMYDVMQIEKWASYFILMIIIVVAVMNIVGSITMIVIQKKKDIGILLSMGLKRSHIKKIFRYQGLYIGLIGSGIGGAVGLLLSMAQKEYGMVKLSSAFIIDAYPVLIQPLDIFLILGGSLFLCIAASLYPAHRASQVEPADAVRNE
ncbi:MAG: FtsX-like permease family protein [Balneolaceae bacterium]